MKYTIHKWFWIWDFDKEEKWINEMSAQGSQLCGVGFFKYVFEDGLAGEYIYRLEMLNKHPSRAESVDYIHFLEDTGAEHIGSVKRWVYFRKKADNGGFDIFSDIDSRINYLGRIISFSGILGGINLLSGLGNMLIYFSSGSVGNFLAGLLGFGIEAGLILGLMRMSTKRRDLAKEKVLHE